MGFSTPPTEELQDGYRLSTAWTLHILQSSVHPWLLNCFTLYGHTVVWPEKNPLSSFFAMFLLFLPWYVFGSLFIFSLSIHISSRIPYLNLMGLVLFNSTRVLDPWDFIMKILKASPRKNGLWRNDGGLHKPQKGPLFPWFFCGEVKKTRKIPMRKNLPDLWGFQALLRDPNFVRLFEQLVVDQGSGGGEITWETPSSPTERGRPFFFFVWGNPNFKIIQNTTWKTPCSKVEQSWRAYTKMVRRSLF